MVRRADNALLSTTSMGTGAGLVTEAYEPYSPLGDLTNVTASIASVAKFTQVFTRDAGGRLLQRDETLVGIRHTRGFHYDTSGRLDGVWVDKPGTYTGTPDLTYGYDLNGNRTTVGGVTTGTFDAQDRLVSNPATGTLFTYTKNGELASKGSVTYTYDALGNLRHVEGLPGGIAIDYVIDGQNRRVGKKRGPNGATVLVQGFVYGENGYPIAELDGGQNVVSVFVYGTHANVPDYVIKPSGADAGGVDAILSTGVRRRPRGSGRAAASARGPWRRPSDRSRRGLGGE